MKHAFRLIAAFMRLDAIRRMEYKADLLVEVLVHGVFQASNVIFFNVLWLNVGGFAGLAPGEMQLLLGTFILADSIFSTFAFFGILDLPGAIREGRLDHCLSKPLPSQFLATFRSPNLLAAMSAFLGIALVVIAARSGQCQVAPLAWAAWAVLVAAGAAVSYSCGLIVMSLAFFLLSVDAVWALYAELVDVQRCPIGIFPKPLRMVFTITLPVLLVANVPTHVALGKMGLAEAAGLLGAAAALVFLSTRVWKRGLRRYQGASG
jgi:ABC-2 type transport system permease protein